MPPPTNGIQCAAMVNNGGSRRHCYHVGRYEHNGKLYCAKHLPVNNEQVGRLVLSKLEQVIRLLSEITAILNRERDAQGKK